MVLGEKLKDLINGRPVWDYKIYSPLSFDDEAEVTIILSIGQDKENYREEVVIPLGKCPAIAKTI